MDRVCEQCGKTFYAKPSWVSRGGGKFCSTECYHLASRTRVEKKCIYCGKSFNALPCLIKNGWGNYCSKECAGKANRNRIEKTCRVCGKSFFVYPSELKSNRNKTGEFCSRQCSGMARRSRITVECKQCGNPFEIRPYAIEIGEGKYCSRECYHKAETGENAPNWQGGRKIGTCEWCGNEFAKPQPSYKFCSFNCSIEFMKARTGKQHHCWRGGISFEPYCPKFNERFKEIVRNRFGRRCFICGKPEKNRRHSVHHIDYNKNSICNGHDWAFVPLCITHHNKTNFDRWYWFNRLIYYWAMNPEINFNTDCCSKV